MMSKRVVYKTIDGNIVQLIPSDNARAQIVKEDGVYRIKPERMIYPRDHKRGKREETEDEFIRRIIEKDVPKDALRYAIIDTKDVPSDRYFRAAWDDIDKKGQVVINRQKAEEIHMEQIRQVRNRKLEELDKEQMMLMSMDKSIEDLKAKKQVLRDVPQSINLKKYRTLRGLKKAWPKELD